MTSLPNPISETAHAVAPDAHRNGILVASDGREPSIAALIAARKLAAHVTFGVLSVVPSSVSRERARRSAEETIDRDERAAVIEAQLQMLFGESPDVWVQTCSGDPAAEITSYADRHGTRLLITGIGRARVIERLLGDESTLSLVRLSKTPILAVAPGCEVPPQRVVVAMDFTPTSVRAAHLGLALASPQAEVIVAHVWPQGSPASPEGAARRMVDALQTGFCGRVTSHVMHGDPAAELLALANSWRADAIAIGLHGHARAEHVGIGTVAMRVVHCASCSVIVTPRDKAN
ncbi:MAG TPA: universal stress protein [Gemmatimonadaceae bacterium]